MMQTTDFFLECPKLVLEVLYTKGDGGYRRGASSCASRARS